MGRIIGIGKVPDWAIKAAGFEDEPYHPVPEGWEAVEGDYNLFERQTPGARWEIGILENGKWNLSLFTEEDGVFEYGEHVSLDDALRGWLRMKPSEPEVLGQKPWLPKRGRAGRAGRAGPLVKVAGFDPEANPGDSHGH